MVSTFSLPVTFSFPEHKLFPRFPAQRGIGLLHDMPIHVGLVDKNEFARFARRDDMWCGVV